MDVSVTAFLKSLAADFRKDRDKDGGMEAARQQLWESMNIAQSCESYDEYVINHGCSKLKDRSRISQSMFNELHRAFHL